MIIVTLDISTKYVAYALWIDDELAKYGKLHVMGKGDEAIGSMSTLVTTEFDGIGVDRVVYESAFLGSNVNVVKQLSKSIGSVVGAFYTLGVREYIAVPPITWQTGIGVGKTSYKDKERLRSRYPDKGMSWLRSKDRENRKQKIIDYVNGRFDKRFTMEDNDVADAIGIGCYIQLVRDNEV